MIRNFVRHLPVHRSHEPATRLGWVRAPHVTRPGPIRFQVGHTLKNLMTGEVTRAGRLDAEVVWLGEVGDRRLAIMTSDASIETWRNVYGFIEERHR